MRPCPKPNAKDMETQINALTGFRRRPAKTPLPCKAQAVLADRDLLFPLADAQKALAPIPDLHIEIIKDAAHSIHWEQPKSVAQSLINFAIH